MAVVGPLCLKTMPKEEETTVEEACQTEGRARSRAVDLPAGEASQMKTNSDQGKGVRIFGGPKNP